MARSTQGASTSRWKYDVFLSFRGDDTRHGLVDHLYRGLLDRGIETYMDDLTLEIGMSISPSTLRAIEESRLAIVVLSPNYASSSWRLDELTKILECSEAFNTQVLPLFYGVEPSDVRYQRGSIEEAFIKHENSDRDRKKVHQWRHALMKVANLSGWDRRNYE